jgi:hypothetical protein
MQLDENTFTEEEIDGLAQRISKTSAKRTALCIAACQNVPDESLSPGSWWSIWLELLELEEMRHMLISARDMAIKELATVESETHKDRLTTVIEICRIILKRK